MDHRASIIVTTTKPRNSTDCLKEKRGEKNLFCTFFQKILASVYHTREDIQRRQGRIHSRSCGYYLEPLAISRAILNSSRSDGSNPRISTVLMDSRMDSPTGRQTDTQRCIAAFENKECTVQEERRGGGHTTALFGPMSISPISHPIPDPEHYK